MSNPTMHILAKTVWAFVTVGQPDAQFFTALARVAERHLSDFNTQDLGNTAWVFAMVGQSDAQLFTALARVAERCMSDVSTQNISNTACAQVAKAFDLPPETDNDYQYDYQYDYYYDNDNDGEQDYDGRSLGVKLEQTLREGGRNADKSRAKGKADKGGRSLGNEDQGGRTARNADKGGRAARNANKGSKVVGNVGKGGRVVGNTDKGRRAAGKAEKKRRARRDEGKRQRQRKRQRKSLLCRLGLLCRQRKRQRKRQRQRQRQRLFVFFACFVGLALACLFQFGSRSKKQDLPERLPMIDGSWQWLRYANDHEHRQMRQQDSAKLQEAFSKGGYDAHVEGKDIKVEFESLQKMINGTTFRSVSAGLPRLGEPLNKGKHHDGNPIDLAVQLTLQGHRVVTVNAASGYHVGGGFTTGGRHALEEAFCSQSTLYKSLTAIPSPNKPYIPADGCLLSPEVEIFRRGSDQGYQLYLKPTKIAGVVSVAMYNRNPRVRDAPMDAPDSQAEYEEGIRKKFVALFHAAASVKADVLIIPDIGCGVFQNDPTVVGRIAGEVLKKYHGHFTCVHFTGKEAFYKAAMSAMTQISPAVVSIQVSWRSWLKIWMKLSGCLRNSPGN